LHDHDFLRRMRVGSGVVTQGGGEMATGSVADPDAPLGYCVVAECDRKAAMDGMCWGHWKQIQQRGRVTGPLHERKSARALLVDAALHMVEIDDSGQYDTAWELRLLALSYAALRYATSRGYVSPRGRCPHWHERNGCKRKAGR
jgi:hypothetical protein